jgi:hypothetical protein
MLALTTKAEHQQSWNNPLFWSHYRLTTVTVYVIKGTVVSVQGLSMSHLVVVLFTALLLINISCKRMCVASRPRAVRCCWWLLLWFRSRSCLGVKTIVVDCCFDSFLKITRGYSTRSIYHHTRAWRLVHPTYGALLQVDSTRSTDGIVCALLLEAAARRRSWCQLLLLSLGLQVQSLRHLNSLSVCVSVFMGPFFDRAGVGVRID